MLVKLLLFCGLLLIAVSAAFSHSQETTHVNVKKITPILYAKEVEPCVKFWVERLGFEKTVEVPDGDKLGFAILQKGDLELMYQRLGDPKDDATFKAQAGKGPTFLYVEVESLDATLNAMRGVEIVIPVHESFYGMKEFGVKDPAGHFVLFAQPSAAPKH
jgi:uncharacterized glyoxalase superfamily protein PhnB